MMYLALIILPDIIYPYLLARLLESNYCHHRPELIIDIGGSLEFGWNGVCVYFTMLVILAQNPECLM